VPAAKFKPGITHLQHNEVTQTIPVIFMTVLMNTEDKVKGFTVGAVDYVTKPIQPAELLARLVTHLRLRDLTRQLQTANEQLQKEIAVRQRAELELKAYRDHLEELVKQRTAELTRANEQLQQEMTERQQAEEEIRQQSQRLRALTARLTEVEETERRRLARELHDRVGQDLGTLDINLNILRAQIPTDAPSLLHSHLNDSLELLKQVAKQVYDVMADLRSPVLDDYGLVAALNWYGAQFTTRTGLKVTVRGQETPRLPLATDHSVSVDPNLP
jgi:signal transduction histidine kinase